jgi:hypothetical protein
MKQIEQPLFGQAEELNDLLEAAIKKQADLDPPSLHGNTES